MAASLRDTVTFNREVARVMSGSVACIVHCAAGQLDMARKMEEKLAASGMVAPPQTSQLLRLSDVQVNGKLEPDGFQIKIPADWAVRDLDAQPKPADCRSLSTPLNPSLNNFGRQPGRFPGRGRGVE